MNSISVFTIHFIGNIFTCTFHTYFWYKLSNKNEKIISKKFLYIVLTLAALMTTNSMIFSNPIKLASITLILMIINYIFISKKVKLAVISTMLSQIISALSELSFAIICSIWFDNNVVERITKSAILYLSINIYTALVPLLLTHFIFSRKIITSIKNIISYIKKKDILAYSVTSITILIIVTIESYMDIPKAIILTTNLIMIILFLILIIRTSIAKSDFNRINDKYQTSISSLKEYETMIDKFRINTHENQNELMTIRNMIKSKDRKTVEYIDALVKNKIKDNEKIMYKTSKIPEGGLRATIYSKLCVMEKNKIDYNLDIAKDVRTVDLINLDEELILNICKILGVFMDNAIEAVSTLKEKNINIELYTIDNSLYIDITNNFKGNINLKKKKYTTKGEGHGYGLALVKQIVKENSDILENETLISKGNFTQTLKIKSRQ